MINFSKSKDWIKVDSAFGGFALYTINSIKKGKYIGRNNLNKEICEHVSLNKSITESGGKIYINPLLINSDKNCHTRFASFFGLFKFFVFCILKDTKDFFMNLFAVNK